MYIHRKVYRISAAKWIHVQLVLFSMLGRPKTHFFFFPCGWLLVFMGFCGSKEVEFNKAHPEFSASIFLLFFFVEFFSLGLLVQGSRMEAELKPKTQLDIEKSIMYYLGTHSYSFFSVWGCGDVTVLVSEEGRWAWWAWHWGTHKLHQHRLPHHLGKMKMERIHLLLLLLMMKLEWRIAAPFSWPCR